MKTSLLLGGAAFSTLSLAQQTAYGQCGGGSWSGATSCVAGYTCSTQNQYYAQCTPGSAAVKAPSTLVTTTTAKAATTTAKAPTTTAKAPTTTTVKAASTSAAATAATTGKFRWLGVDESGAEFGGGNIPGTYNTDFTFPSNSSIDTLIGEGFNIFRVPFLMERMVPTTLTASPNAAYLANYTGIINHITSKGAYAVIDPHNFGRYYGNVITDASGFQAFWTTVAGAFKGNTKVIFDTNNEFHDEDQTNVLNMNQAAINGIRAAGATSQYIFVEGNSYSGAWTWNTTNDNLKGLTDTQNKIIYEMHQYLDSDGSGTSSTCVSSDIGVQRVEGATAWLRANGKLGVLGEYAGGANSVCMTAITGMLSHMQANSDVWLGALWWGGGPWWGDYIYSFEPPSGTGYQYYLTTLEGYKP